MSGLAAVELLQSWAPAKPAEAPRLSPSTHGSAHHAAACIVAASTIGVRSCPLRPSATSPGLPAVLPVPPPAHAPEAIVKFVQMVAPEYKLQPHLVLSVIHAESNFDASAVSPKDAHGLMQLIPATAARFGVRNIKDPVQNIRGGMAYLRWLMARFEGDITLAAAAYNAGEGAVERYLGVPPYAETRLYVLKIRAGVAGQRFHPYDPTAAEPSPLMATIRAAAQRAAGR